MVKRLWGKCDGADIIFSENETTGRWETTVPASESGTYIFELWAEDYAGNVGYFATIKAVWDSSQLCMRFYVIHVGERWTAEEVLQELAGSSYAERVLEDKIIYGIMPDLIREKIIRCEVCGQ